MARMLVWLESSYKDFFAFPEEVQDDVKVALLLTSKGGKAGHAKPLLGFSGASVLEIVERDRSGAYSCILEARMSKFSLDSLLTMVIRLGADVTFFCQLTESQPGQIVISFPQSA